MVTFNSAVLLTAMCRPSTIQRKDTVAFPMVMLQWNMYCYEKTQNEVHYMGENLHEHIFKIYDYYMKHEILMEGNVTHTAF